MTLKSKTYITKSPLEIQKVGVEWLRKGARVFLLNGQLGAGKTTLVRGLATELGWEAEVQSPTFTLMKEYPVSAKKWKKTFDSLVHIDLYRVQDEKNPLPIEEWLHNPRLVVAIEWPGQVWHIPGAVEVNMTLQADESRLLSVIPL